MKGSRDAANGFTLIEAMISMFFIAFIFGELAMVSGYAGRSTNYARRITEANMLAEGILEKSRNTNYRNLDTPLSYKFDLVRNVTCAAGDPSCPGILESYSEVCDPAGTIPTVCTCDAAGYRITRTITSKIPSATTSFGASTAATVDVVVSWSVTEIVGEVQTTGEKDVKVSTVRSKF